jgi:hypothetical protein
MINSRFREFIDTNFTIVDIIADEHSGPRAIATRVMGHQKKHAKVRRSICQYMLSLPTFWANQKKIQDLSQFIQNQLMVNERFTGVEMRAAAKLYDLPIIIFLPTRNTPHFDYQCRALTLDGNRKPPLYLLQQGSHF